MRPQVGDLYLDKETQSDGEDGITEDLVKVANDVTNVNIYQIVLPVRFFLFNRVMFPAIDDGNISSSPLVSTLHPKQLPGYNIQYPKNEIGKLYEEILRGDGVELSKGNIPEATAKGSYRKLLQRASKLTWSAVLEEGKVKPDVSDDPVVDTARLTFELKSGCYATMMLRELMVTTMSRDTCKMYE
jgi:tRNA(Glu) U13 pseudouridine synthase TruD